MPELLPRLRPCVASEVGCNARTAFFGLEPTPRSWAERAYPKLIYFNEVNKGGHFAAWEQPELFAQEIQAAFRRVAERRWAARTRVRCDTKVQSLRGERAYPHRASTTERSKEARYGETA